MTDERTLMNERSLMDERIIVLTDDITRQDVDAIVNAANSTLLGGGGVDGAIHDAGGVRILEECREIRRTLYPDGLPTGEAVITSGGNLLARHVIHTVGPIYGRHNGREAKLLARCYERALALAAAHELTSIAFPAISTGAYGYPRAEAARVVVETLRNYFAEQQTTIKGVRLVFFSESDARIFKNAVRF